VLGEDEVVVVSIIEEGDGVELIDELLGCTVLETT